MTDDIKDILARARAAADAADAEEAPAEAAAKVVEPLEIDAEVADEKDTLTAQYKKAADEKAARAGGDSMDENKGSGEKEKGVGEEKPFVRKFRLKIERFARLFAEGEKLAYARLNAPYKEVYAQETTEDINFIIENRIALVSEYGDVLNLAFDLVGHAVESGLEARVGPGAQQKQNGNTGGGKKWF